MRFYILAHNYWRKAYITINLFPEIAFTRHKIEGYGMFVVYTLSFMWLTFCVNFNLTDIPEDGIV